MTRRTRVAMQLMALSIVLAISWPGSKLRAQELIGTIAGQLIDQTDSALPGALVVITNRQTGRVITVATDSTGRYHAHLEPGSYSVRLELSGFARLEILQVEIVLGRTVTINQTMTIGDLSEAVHVTAHAGSLNDGRSTIIADNITAEEIDRLPKGRSFQSVALIAPSVNAGDMEGGIQVNGASGAENAFTVDGVNTTSLVNGSSRQNTVFEYVQEVQVKTTGIPAEFGGALGGVISAVTKSGGNIFRGETHYYFGASSLNAGPARRLVLDPDDEKTIGYVQDQKQPERQHQFGGTVGGPIIRNRLFYLGSFTPGFHRRTNNYLFSSGRDKGEISSTSKVIHGFGKLSLSLGPATWYVSSLTTPAYVDGSLPAYNGFGGNWISSSKHANEVNVKRGWQLMQVNTTAKADIVLSNSALATFGTGLFQDRYSDSGLSPVTSYIYQTAASAAIGLPESFRGPAGTQNAPRALITNFDTTKRISINADYSHRIDGAGRHTVKGGIGYQHVLNEVDSRYSGGYVDIFWGLPAVFPGQAVVRGTYGHYTVTNRGLFGKAGAGIVSLYLQDQWQVGDRLTFNVGVRAENEKVPAYRTETRKYVLDFPFAEKIAPRFGLSYDVNGSGRAKLYASWGRYFNSMNYGLARSLFGGEIWCTYYRAIDDPAHPLSANLSYMPGRDLWTSGGSCRDRQRPRFDIVDPNTKPMSQHSTSAGFDFEVSARTVATIHYVRNSLNRTIEDVVALLNGEAVYLISNPGEGNSRLMPALTAPLTSAGSFPMPKAKRQYDAVELGISRRFSGNWFASGNLTISRLYGNYAGLAGSDEIRTPTTGVSAATAQQQAGSIAREGGNLNRGWDVDDAMFDAYGNLDILGRLATDRPVVAKFYGAFNVARKTQIGAFVYIGSGTPISTYVNTVNQTQVFVEGRGDMGRTPVFSKTDLLVSHELPMAGAKRLRLELNVLNLFNQKTARHLFNYLNRGAGSPRASSAIDLHDFDLFQGYDYNALIRATPDGANAFDPRYGMADLWEPGTQGQVSVKFLF